jgi:hypothetical protein
MVFKNNPYVVRREALDLTDAVESNIARCLSRRPGAYVLRAEIEREKQAYKTALEKEPTVREVGHTYVPRALKSLARAYYVPRALRTGTLNEMQ